MNGQTKAHVWQVAAILLPTLGGMFIFYGAIRADISKAMDDNVRQDRELTEIRRNEREFETETRAASLAALSLLNQVKQDTAVISAVAKSGVVERKR